MHLGELEQGRSATVVGIAQGEGFCHLCSLGLNVGAQVEVVRRLSRGRVLVVRVDGADVALRDGTAATVKVRSTQL